MGEKGFIAQPDPQDEPALRHNTVEPRGVMQKNLKALLYIGAVVIVVIALALSSFRRRRHRLRTNRRLRSLWSRTTRLPTSRHYSNRLPQTKHRDKQDAAMAAAAGAGTSAQQTAAGTYGATGQLRTVPGRTILPTAAGDNQ